MNRVDLLVIEPGGAPLLLEESHRGVVKQKERGDA